jgi:hypothetical protein
MRFLYAEYENILYLIEKGYSTKMSFPFSNKKFILYIFILIA